MNDRERFVAYVLGDPVDRPPYWLFWRPWHTALARWRREGMPAAIQNANDLRAYFGSDLMPNQAVVPINCGPCPRIPKTVLAEDDASVTFIDTWGIKRRDLKRGESMSQFLAHPVTDAASWERFRDQYLNPDDPARLAGEWRVQCAEWTAKGTPIQLGWYPDAGVFGPLRWLLGDEECLVAFHTIPDLVHAIMDHMTSLYLTVWEQVVSTVQVDVLHLWEDLCYRKGPLISPRAWDAFLGPNYRRIHAFARQHGIPIISVDTDGDPSLLAEPMVRSGVNLLYPMEVAAGCDVNAWRSRRPTLALMGGVDKRALAVGPAAIDAELARVQPALAAGRYIPALDHLVPDDVAWDNYAYYAAALRRLVGKP